MPFEVTQEKYAGPLGLLLELIEEKSLPITEVSLAEVTEGYLKYLENEKVPVEELADFLLVASRLIYLKSRELMPYLQSKEEDEGVDELEEQLRLYKEYVEAAKILEARFGKEMMHERPFVKLRRDEPVFSPPPSLKPSIIEEVYRNVLKRLEPFFALSETSMERVKSLEERIEELTSAIKTRATISFKEVMKGARSKMEVVVSFLALLELLRRRTVTVKQDSAFSDIELVRAD
jgi:segregation and condensation protein A